MKHPYNNREPIPRATCVLIVGTAPPPRFNDPKSLRGDDFDFFYGSEDNYMWEHLDKIAEEIDGSKLFGQTETVIDGKTKLIYSDTSDQCCEIARSFLRKHHLWMKDILEEYERKAGKEHLASDDAIEEPDPSDYTDFVSILADNTRLSTLAFTSKKAAIWTMKRLMHQDALQGDRLNELIRRIENQKERGEFWKGGILGQHMRIRIVAFASGRRTSLGGGRSAVQRPLVLSSRRDRRGEDGSSVSGVF